MRYQLSNAGTFGQILGGKRPAALRKRPGGSLGQAQGLTMAAQALESARRFAQNVAQNYRNLVVAIGEQNAAMALAEAEASVTLAEQEYRAAGGA